MKEINRLKSHINVIKKELEYTSNQIKFLEKNENISEWENIDNIKKK